jgi:hypothetical protein
MLVGRSCRRDDSDSYEDLLMKGPQEDEKKYSEWRGVPLSAIAPESYEYSRIPFVS